MRNSLYLLMLVVPSSCAAPCQALLFNDAPWGWEEKEPGDGRALFGIYAEERETLEKIAAEAVERCPDAIFTLEEVENRDWQSAWREFFTPVEAGEQFVILPPWLAHLTHTKRREIIIEPRTAFGTGHHASTRLCLACLGDLLSSGRIGKGDWFLDLGCGSGVLGLAAAKAGLDGTGLDIDPVAISNSRENRELNEADNLELLKGGIEKVKGEKYDLVMANILSETLIDLAPQIVAAMKEDGCLILGGILSVQADSVIQAYERCGLGECSRLTEEEWCALLWQ